MSYITNINNNTTAKRDELKKRFDKFTTFKWGGLDMWREFGAFLVNEKKGSLQFLNGPQFSNSYTNSQFGTAATLNGVKINTRKFTIQVALYWFSIQEYRRFINLFNPYAVNDIVFDHSPDWRYFVKPTSVPDSVKQVVGYEYNKVTGQQEERYYTEVKLTFEVQGEIGVLANESYRLTGGEEVNTTSGKQRVFKINNTKIESDFATPMKWNIAISPLDNSDNNDITLSLGARWQSSSISKNSIDKNLFTISLNNINTVIGCPGESGRFLNITYLSESGTLLWNIGDTTTRLLSLTSNSNGERILKTLLTESFMLPGRIDYNDFNLSDIEFVLRYSGCTVNSVPIIESYARTNVI